MNMSRPSIIFATPSSTKRKFNQEDYIEYNHAKSPRLDNFIHVSTDGQYSGTFFPSFILGTES